MRNTKNFDLTESILAKAELPTSSSSDDSLNLIDPDATTPMHRSGQQQQPAQQSAQHQQASKYVNSVSWSANYSSVLRRQISQLHFGDALISLSGKFAVHCKPDIDNVKKTYYILVDDTIQTKRKRIESVASNLLEFGCSEKMQYLQQGAISAARLQFSEGSDYLDYLPLLDFTPKGSLLHRIPSSNIDVPLNRRRLTDALKRFVVHSFRLFVKEENTRWLKTQT